MVYIHFAHLILVDTSGSPASEGKYDDGFVIVRPIKGEIIPKVIKDKVEQNKHITVAKDEKTLLADFSDRLLAYDPDVIVGHNFYSFDLDVLLHRMKIHGTSWSRLGRLKRSKIPNLQQGAGGTSNATWGEKQIMSGRLVCDIFTSAQEFVKQKDYKLNTLANDYLKTYGL